MNESPIAILEELENEMHTYYNEPSLREWPGAEVKFRIDVRYLNQVIKVKSCPMPKVGQLNGTKYFPTNCLRVFLHAPK